MSSGSGRKRPLRADRRASATRTAKPAAKKARKPARKSASARKSARRRTPSRRKMNPIRRLFRWIVRMIWGLTWRVGLIAGMILAGAVALDYSKLPQSASDLLDGRARGSVTLMDRQGEVYAWRGDQFGGVITAGTVSPHLKNAIVATEDRRFYRHFGVSPRGVIGAIRINLREGRGALEGHGGSTITQQTAKLLCVGTPFDPEQWKNEAAYEADCRAGSITRKAREAIYAMAMEARYSKDEILTIYMNRAYLGAGARGFEAASQRYFGKSASDVSASEAAMMAGLLVAPSRYAPTADLERSRERAETVISLMEDQGYISETEAAQAIARPAGLSAAAEARAGGYFADWIMESAPSFLTSETTEDVLIRTTFDPRLQRAAEAAMEEVFATKVSPGSKAQAAIVVMSSDGAVRAMVGGRDTKVSGAFNRAAQAQRQTGSAFKPFVYATALELGYRYDDTVEDAPLTINVPGSGPWSPKNYTRDFKGRVTLTDALAQSLNIPAVKVSEAVGRENVRKVAADFGIPGDLAQGPALALGTSEASLLDMTAAYAGILNGGSSVVPYGLTELRLMGDREPLMGGTGGIGERVISQAAAQQLVYMMNQVVETGTGGRARLEGWPAAGKTGTTQAARDAWFIGFTGAYVAGVWMGYDDNTPLKGVTGGGLPAEIWRETMTRVHAGLQPQPLPIALPPAQQRTASVTEQTSPSAPSQQRRGPDPVGAAEKVINNVLGLFRRN